MSDTYKITKAIMYAVKYGGIDGDHHKAWVIDQMVRALTGSPDEHVVATDSRGKMYEYTTQGKSDAYKKLITDACMGEDGTPDYSWDEGIAP